MLFKEYLKKAMKTNGCGQNSLYFLYALTGEIGELVDELKKVAYHNHEINQEKILKEVGDILWGIAYFENLHKRSDEDISIYDKIIDSEIFKGCLLENDNYLHTALHSGEPNFVIKLNENDLRSKIDVVTIKLLSVSAGVSEEYNNLLERNVEKNSVDVLFVERIMLHNLQYTSNRVRRKVLQLVTILNFICEEILDSSISLAMDINIEKLMARYKGEFSPEKSIKRVDVK